MYLRDGFARVIFQVNDRALGGRLMPGMYRFSKLLKSLALQLISLFPHSESVKDECKEAVMMPVSRVGKSWGAGADGDETDRDSGKDLQAIPVPCTIQLAVPAPALKAGS